MYREVYGLPSVILRPANIYGESQDMSKPLGALGHFTRKAFEQVPIEIWGDGSAVRDYVHVDDVVEAMLAAAKYTGDQHIFNVGSGEGISLLDIVRALDAMTERTNPVVFREGRSFDVARNVLDSGRAKTELGWQAKINLHAGIKRMLESFK
jgi:UDP-glucose 4-epimerase